MKERFNLYATAAVSGKEKRRPAGKSNEAIGFGQFLRTRVR
jgi:hypothetical protein